mmetsp:Transcript_46968/g.94134  ORF Transcript_46968/g.94134 Transcript_46968/m.94134 type:complete len:165 (-) Transcript_46968:85-579(-)
MLSVRLLTAALVLAHAAALSSMDVTSLAAFALPHPPRASPIRSLQVSRRTHDQVPTMQLFSAPGGAAVLEKKPTIKTAPEGEDQQAPDKPYHVLLFNDPMNTREYVCDVLVEVFGHSKTKAYDIMQTAHTSGFAVCNTTDKEEADVQSAKLGEKNLMSSVVQAD